MFEHWPFSTQHEWAEYILYVFAFRWVHHHYRIFNGYSFRTCDEFETLKLIVEVSIAVVSVGYSCLKEKNTVVEVEH